MAVQIIVGVERQDTVDCLAEHEQKNKTELPIWDSEIILFPVPLDGKQKSGW